MITVTGVEDIEKKLNQLAGIADKRLMQKLGNSVLSASRKRITQQSDLTGTAWQTRSPNTDDKKRKKKMMTGLRKRMRVLSVSDTQATIGFSGIGLKIATEQQLGKRYKLTKAQQRAKANLSAKASKRQAQEMIKLGFTLNGKSPSIKKITDRYTIGQAGWILRKLRQAKGISDKSSFDVVLPARSWLGINKNDEQALLTIIETKINQLS